MVLQRMMARVGGVLPHSVNHERSAFACGRRLNSRKRFCIRSMATAAGGGGGGDSDKTGDATISTTTTTTQTAAAGASPFPVQQQLPRNADAWEIAAQGASGLVF